MLILPHLFQAGPAHVSLHWQSPSVNALELLFTNESARTPPVSNKSTFFVTHRQHVDTVHSCEDPWGLLFRFLLVKPELMDLPNVDTSVSSSHHCVGFATRQRLMRAGKNPAVITPQLRQKVLSLSPWRTTAAAVRGCHLKVGKSPLLSLFWESLAEIQLRPVSACCGSNMICFP